METWRADRRPRWSRAGIIKAGTDAGGRWGRLFFLLVHTPTAPPPIVSSRFASFLPPRLQPLSSGFSRPTSTEWTGQGEGSAREDAHKT